MVGYGQVVVGPPGSGKTTYCAGMQQILTAMGRPCAVINLDPAQEDERNLPYSAAVNLTELVTVPDVMEQYGLGPNGAMIFALEYLLKNFDWLETHLENLKGRYLLFDLPGQVELFTHKASVRTMVQRLLKIDYRLTAVNLIDAHYCTNASKFVSVLLCSLAIMLELELPHVNVLSKIDLIEQYGKLDFNLDFYTDVLDLDYLMARLDEEPGMAKHARLTRALCEVVEDYSLVNFQTLDIQNKDSAMHLLTVVDKANGFCGPSAGAGPMGSNFVIGKPIESDARWVSDVQERYIDNSRDSLGE